MSRAKLPRHRTPTSIVLQALPALLLLAAPVNAAMFGAKSAPAIEYDPALKNSMLAQALASRNLPKKPYQPPENLLKPYKNASLGAPLALAVVNNVNFVNAAEAQVLAQSVADRLLTAWTGPKAPVKVMITAEPVYGAFANPSGMVFIAMGTFSANPAKGVSSTDELALMLGHELTHILLQQLGKQDRMAKMTKVVNAISSGMVTYGAVKNTHMVGDNVRVQGDKTLMEQTFVSGLAVSALLTDVFAPSFGRAAEFDADRMGIDLARAAGYTVTEDEVAQFIRKHADYEARRTVRLARLETVAKAAVKQLVVAQANNQFGSYAGLLGPLTSSAADSAINASFDSLTDASKSHPTLAERETSAKAYLALIDAAADEDSKPLVAHDLTGLKAVTEAPANRQLVAQLIAADSEWTTLVAGTAPGRNTATGAAVAPAAAPSKVMGTALPAVAEAKPRKGKASRKPQAAPSAPAPVGYMTDQAPFTWLVNGTAQRGASNIPAALDAYRRGARSDIATVQMLQALGQTSATAGNAAELAALGPLIERYGELIGTTNPILDVMVAQALGSGNVGLAEVRAADCYSYDSGSLYPSCVALLGYDPMQDPGARTPEGKKAFSGKFMEKQVRDLKSVTGLFD